MKKLLSYVVGALALGAVTLGLLAAAGIERELAAADRALSTLELNRAARGYADVQRRLGWTTSVPWLFEGTRAQLTARQAAVRYWRGEYGGLVGDYTGTDSPSMAGNLSLQLIVANADYLAVRRPGAGREAALGALDHAVGVYRRLLEANESDRDAAYNYELVLRLRAEIAGGDEVPPFSPPTVPGAAGENPEEAEMEDVQIYVPQESIFDPDETEDPTVGEGAPIRRRG